MENQMVMKKVTAVLVLLGMIIGTAACSAKPFKEKSDYKNFSNYEDFKVDLSVKVLGTRVVQVDFLNQGDQTFTFGKAYSLEYEQDGEWYKVPMDIAFTQEAIYLGPSTKLVERSQNVPIPSDNYSDIYDLGAIGKLPAGHYRMIKEFVAQTDAGAGDSYVTAAEFDLEKEG
jgi:hypothetical protein